jgi:hypothetical protein
MTVSITLTSLGAQAVRSMLMIIKIAKRVEIFLNISFLHKYRIVISHKVNYLAQFSCQVTGVKPVKAGFLNGW